MITTISLPEYSAALGEDIKEQELECAECDGTGECPCCERDCLECDGTGSKLKTLSDREVHAMYFVTVMKSLKKLCAYSSRHDFLIEAGDFIKANGRPDTRFDWLNANDCHEAPYINTVH
ncbi:hypothetical protein [Vreelandella neptunia]|uniref:Uncharacterized protein n=1 Tax=Vreelandella neptunia TaxID=115551 RepID=A0ABZ0YQZ3_9GAMM|nr:hypothetical protein [Halomonas neptunia]MDN3561677.1 hypothetical protein [Halomonas neptunia]WQH14579.1 hypothetical protein SR894_08580 [Halomonas neptunia]